VKWGVEGGYNQGHFESLPRGGWGGWVCDEKKEMSAWDVGVRESILGGCSTKAI